jgi:hypothetical protein
MLASLEHAVPTICVEKVKLDNGVVYAENVGYPTVIVLILPAVLVANEY